jgi:hypothetical protein
MNQATILVAQEGKVLVNASYNVPPQARHQPTTTIPNFDLGDISRALEPGFFAPAGMAHTRQDTASKRTMSNVDNLYRFERFISVGTDVAGSMLDQALAELAQRWKTDTVFATVRQSVYGTPDGKRHAYVRFPLRKTAIIILSNGDAIDARDIAQRIAERLLGS